MHGSRSAIEGRRRPGHRSRAVIDERRWRFPRRLVTAGIAMTVVTWWFATKSEPTSVDRQVGRWALELPDSLEAPLDLALRSGSLWVCAMVAAIALCAGRFRLSLGLAVGGATAWAATTIVGRIVSSPRPTTDQLPELVRSSASGNGYPATPVAVAVAMLLMLLASVRSTRVMAIGRPLGADALVTMLAIGLAATTGMATLYVGIYWFTDVVGGAGVGIVAGFVGVRAGRRRRSVVSNQWI